MGFNMNYSLLLEGQNSKYSISSYTPIDNSDFLNEASILQLLFECNQEIRFQRSILEEVYEEPFNEAFSLTTISDTAKAAFNKMIEFVVKIKNLVLEKLNKLLSEIKLRIATHKDKIEEKHKLHERVSMLEKALKDAEEKPRLTIRSIDYKDELKDPDFPDTSVIGSDLASTVVTTLDKCISNIDKKNGSSIEDSVSNEAEIVEAAKKLLDSKKDEILLKIFKNYKFDTTNLTASRLEVSKEIFEYGSEFEEKKLDSSLYLKACGNIDELIEIQRDIQKKLDEVNKNYSKLTSEIQKAQREVDRLDTLAHKADNYSVDMKKRYHDSMKQILPIISSTLSTVNEIVSVDHGFLMDKSRRIFEIIEDSAKVKRLAHRLIQKNLGIEDEEVINGKESTNEIYQIQDEFNIAIALVEETFREQEFNNFVDQIINEAVVLEDGENAEGDAGNGAQAADAAQTTAPANNQQTITTQTTTTGKVGAVGDRIKAVLDKLIGNLGITMKKFQERIVTLVDKPYWDKNKANIQKLQLTDTKVNEWYSYNFDALEKSTYIKFTDPNSTDFQNDENIQKKILNMASGGTLPNTIKDEDTFAQKLTKIYQGQYTNEQNSEGKTLAEIQFNSQKVFEYVDDFATKGFSAGALGSVNNDYKALSEDYKNVQRNYQSYLDQMKAGDAENTTTVTQKTEVKTEPQNAAAINDSDFRFNLAEHFGLMDPHIIPLGEAEINVGGGDRAQAAANGGESVKDKRNAELDARITRCYRYNITAITAKMTASIAAYKQFMSLYRAVYKKGNGKAQNQEQQTTTTQQTTTQTQQEQK